MENQGEYIVRLMEAMENLNLEDGDSVSNIASYLYNPDPHISDYLLKLKEYLELTSPSGKQLRDAGDLLEQVATLAFCGLKGINSIKSFRSAGPQYDLLVSGDSFQWLFLQKLLYRDGQQRDILVEAKCTSEKVSDPQFARLCSLMEINLFQTVGVGVFFTLKGATGFPERNGIRQKKLSEARLRQALFHARTGKSIVVLDVSDIFLLDKPASLAKILIRKIRDLEYLSGLPSKEIYGESEVEVDVPKHLEYLLKRFNH
jgi:hypothetical protein